ncbi:MAG: Rossmann-like and DUF2520 domain-containing protein [Moorellaceae bacterium]
MKVGIIGAGSVGTGMGLLLKERGYTLVGVSSRTYSSAEKAAARLNCPAWKEPEEVARRAEVVFVTTSDQAVAAVAHQVAAKGGFRPGQTVIHMSGSLTSEVLNPARRHGAWALSLHPLQSCADADRAVANLPGSVFSIEGDREAYPLAERLVKDLGGEFFYIRPEDKALYHAAACVASNYLVSLVDLSYQLMAAAGMNPQMAAKALAPLIEGTWKNIREKGILAALTGPISRGDVSTVGGHLKAMREKTPHLLDIYSALGRRTVEVARRKGTLGEREAAAFLRLFAATPGRAQGREAGYSG